MGNVKAPATEKLGSNNLINSNSARSGLAADLCDQSKIIIIFFFFSLALTHF